MSTAEKLRNELFALLGIVFAAAGALGMAFHHWRRAREEARGPDLEEALRRARRRRAQRVERITVDEIEQAQRLGRQ